MDVTPCQGRTHTSSKLGVGDRPTHANGLAKYGPRAAEDIREIDHKGDLAGVRVFAILELGGSLDQPPYHNHDHCTVRVRRAVEPLVDCLATRLLAGGLEERSVGPIFVVAGGLESGEPERHISGRGVPLLDVDFPPPVGGSQEVAEIAPGFRLSDDQR